MKSAVRRIIIARLLLIFYALAFITHALVIIGVVPFSWVNGGRSASYATQCTLSLVSCAFIVIFAGISRWAIRAKRAKIGATVLYVFAVWWLLGAILQLLGTPFEKIVMFPLNIFGIIIHVIAAQFVTSQTATKHK